MRNVERKGEQGQVLVLIPVIFILVLILAGGVIDLGSAYLTQARLQSALDSGALAGADALQQGKGSAAAASSAENMVKVNGYPLQFQQDPTSPDSIGIDSSTGTVQLTAHYQAPTYFMKMFGRNSIPLTVTAKAKAGTSPVFNYAIFANKSLDMQMNNLTVDGNVHSNGTMQTSTNNETVTGNVEVHGNYSASGNHIYYGGNLVHPASVIPMPQFDLSHYKSMAGNQGTVYSQSLTVNQNNVTFNNMIFVNGDVNIQVNNLYCTMIVATGSINIQVNNMTQTTNQGLMSIFAGGNITIHDNNSKDIQGFFYAPKGEIDVQANNLKTMQGAIIGNSIVLHENNIDVSYDKSVPSLGGGGGQVRLVN